MDNSDRDQKFSEMIGSAKIAEFLFRRAGAIAEAEVCSGQIETWIKERYPPDPQSLMH